MANKAEIIYETPIRVKCIDDGSGKYLKNGRTYKCLGEFHQSNGGILYTVIDETKFDNFYTKDRFVVIGNWDKVEIDVIVESEE